MSIFILKKEKECLNFSVKSNAELYRLFRTERGKVNIWIPRI